MSAPALPPPFSWIFRDFWFIAAAVMAINVFILKRRLARAVERGNATQAEVDSFLRWFAIYFVGGSLLFGVTGVATGSAPPLCDAVRPMTDPRRMLLLAIGTSGWAVLLWWVWRGNGASVLSRLAPALKQPPDYDRVYSPRVVRGVVTAMAVISSAVSVIGQRTALTPPELACPTGTRAAEAGAGR